MILNGASQATVERYIFLQAQSAELQQRWNAVRDYRDYYGGDHPVFLTDRQQEYLGPLMTRAEHTVAFNVCKAVVDTLRERIKVEGFTGKGAAGEALAEKAAEWFRDAQMDVQQITIHRRTGRDGNGYVIVDWDAEGEHPRWVPGRAYDGREGITYHIDPDTNQPIMAIKYWTVTNPLGVNHGEKRRTVYLPDRILRQREDPKGEYGWGPIDPIEGKPLQWWVNPMPVDGFEPDASAEPLGVACVQWQTPGGVSDIEDLIGLQNGINKTMLDLLAAGSPCLNSLGVIPTILLNSVLKYRASL